MGRAVTWVVLQHSEGHEAARLSSHLVLSPPRPDSPTDLSVMAQLPVLALEGTSFPPGPGLLCFWHEEIHRLSFILNAFVPSSDKSLAEMSTQITASWRKPNSDKLEMLASTGRHWEGYPNICSLLHIHPNCHRS